MPPSVRTAALKLYYNSPHYGEGSAGEPLVDLVDPTAQQTVYHPQSILPLLLAHPHRTAVETTHKLTVDIQLLSHRLSGKMLVQDTFIYLYTLQQLVVVVVRQRLHKVQTVERLTTQTTQRRVNILKKV